MAAGMALLLVDEGVRTRSTATLRQLPQQTSNVVADADTYVVSTTPTGNFGGSTVLRVGSATARGGLAVYRTLVRFDGIDSSIPAGVEVDAATLRLEHLGGAGSLVIAARVLTATWQESAVTWDTQPGSDPPESTRAVGTGAGTYDWDVTEQVQAWVDGTPNHGFLLRAADETTTISKDFRAREDSTAPVPPVRLEVMWHRVTPTPTPSPTPSNMAVRPTETPGATPTLRTETPTASASPTRETDTATPIDATATATDTATSPARTATDQPSPTVPAVATVEPGVGDLTLDLDCATAFTLGQQAAIQLTIRLWVPGEVRPRQPLTATHVSLAVFPGPRHLGEHVVAPSQPSTIAYRVEGPPGPQALVAEVLEGDGAVGVCRFDVVAPATRTPTATPAIAGFVAPTPPTPEIYLPLAAKRGRPLGPGQIAPNPARAEEVDVEWLSYLPHPRLLVTAQGNGAHYRLSLWQVGASGAPAWVSDGPIMPGFDVRAERLTPGDGGPSGLDRILVSAARLANGQLWLRSWTLDGGQLIALDAHGYGPGDHDPTTPSVARFAIAARPEMSGAELWHYQVVTPIVTDDDQARVLSWRVNPSTGQITGSDDTGDWQAIAPASDIDIAYLPDAQVQLDPGLGFTSDDWYDSDLLYAMTFRTATGVQGQWILRVADNGGIGWYGGGETGVSLRGTSDVAYNMTVARVVPIARTGFITVRRDGADDDPEAFTWDYRAVAGKQGLIPHRVGRSDWDLAPDDKGIELDIDNPLDDAYIGSDVDGERAVITDGSWEAAGTGDGRLFSKAPLGKGPAGGMASVTKVMTLLVTLQAVSAGTVGLDDVVIVPPEGAEGAPAWMSPPLEAGDQIELRTLLHGLMKRSSNGAARSIAWHVAGAKYGSGLSYQQRFDAFVDDMNDRAADLDLDDTLYCGVQGGSHSTPQDQVTLWRAASGHPLFPEFAGVNTYAPPCAQDANNDPKCFALLAKGDLGLPGLAGEKNGLKGVNGGVGYAQGQLSCSAYDADSPFDACRQCRIGAVTRLNRTLLAAVQQSDDSAGDVGDLIAYGLVKQFTPDRRGSGLEQNPVGIGQEAVDFGLSSFGGQVAEPPVSVVLNAQHEVRVCTLNAHAGLGQAAPEECAERAAPFLGVGGPYRPDPRLELVRVDSLGESEADVLTAHRDDLFLRFQVWRVAPREKVY
jgi:hypothetical protein